MRLLSLITVLGACGDDATTIQPDGGDVDASIDSPPGCSRPDLDASWLRPFLEDAVSDLAAAPRALSTERTTARTYQMTQLQAMGWTAQLQSYANGVNVIATIPATMGDEKTIVVGAHFDTVQGSPGANDNASGTAVVLAVARYLQDTPCRTAPVVIAFFDQELGLFGSRAYAQTLSPANVRAVHTIDQVAWDADNDRVFELELPTPTLETEWRAAATMLGVTLTTTTTTGTDHQAFRDRGFAAVGLTEEYVGNDTSPHRHQASDTSASIQPYLVYLELAAQLTAAVIIEEVSP